MCYIQLLLQLVLFGWVSRLSNNAENILLLLVYVRLFLVYVLISDADFSFSEILNLLSFLGALSFKPYNFCSFRGCSSLWFQAHTRGWRRAYVEWIWPISFSDKFLLVKFCLWELWDVNIIVLILFASSFLYFLYYHSGRNARRQA